jgi:hypothetical protein
MAHPMSAIAVGIVVVPLPRLIVFHTNFYSTAPVPAPIIAARAVSRIGLKRAAPA